MVDVKCVGLIGVAGVVIPGLVLLLALNHPHPRLTNFTYQLQNLPSPKIWMLRKEISGLEKDIAALLARMKRLDGELPRTGKEVELLKNLVLRVEMRQREKKILQDMCGALVPCVGDLGAAGTTTPATADTGSSNVTFLP